MKNFCVIIVVAVFLNACSNNSDNTTVTDSVSTNDTIVDTTARGSDSVGTKMNITTNSDTNTKSEQP